MPRVQRTSVLSGKIHVREIDVDPEKLASWLAGSEEGYIQDVFPNLSADDREFLLSGITPEEWDNATLPPEERVS